MDYSIKGNSLKLETLLIMENILLVLFLLINYDSLPNWFKYLDKIKFNYIFAISDTKNRYKNEENKFNNQRENTL